MENKWTNTGEHTVRVWQMLVLAAGNQQLLTPVRVASFAGIEKEVLPEALGRIHNYCKKNGYPLLNCLVVTRETGLPGLEFPDKMDRMTMRVEQAKVFDFDWGRCEKPQAYEFMLSEEAKKDEASK